MRAFQLVIAVGLVVLDVAHREQIELAQLLVTAHLSAKAFQRFRVVDVAASRHVIHAQVLFHQMRDGGDARLGEAQPPEDVD